MLRIVLLAFLFLSQTINQAGAVEPDEILDDPVLEARARAISRQLRCVVCQSENIDDSNAPLAKDMRLLVRERLQEGGTDQEVLDFFVERYGAYVLLKPPLQKNTIILWVAPLGFLVVAGCAVFLIFRQREKTALRPLSKEQEQMLEELL